MNVTPKLDHIEENFVLQYIQSCGVVDIDRYINPDVSCFDNPFAYPNMDKAIALFNDCVNEKLNIGVVMDSDQDGVCSAAIVYLFCQSLGITPIVFNHEGKQHGIHDCVEAIKSANIDLLIVPDAGSNDVEDCHDLAVNNIHTIVLDHHEIEADNPYAVIVNHHLGNGLNTALSGTGVTYKFVQAYCNTFKIDEPDYNDLVAVSIVSDICDLTALENRAFVNQGLNNPVNPFLIYLFAECCNYRGVTPSGIGWDVSPLANALARADEQESKRLFFDALVGNIGKEDALKQMRRVKRTQDNAVKQVVTSIEGNLDTTHKAIIGFGNVDDKSYLGLVANKFCGRYNKPTILLRELNSTTWTGSMRSPIDLASKINESKLAQAQGHEAACGITVKKANLKRFAKWLDALDIDDNPPVPVTACILPENININLCNSIVENKILWGKGIDAPTFYLRFKVDKSNVFVYKKE